MLHFKKMLSMFLVMLMMVSLLPLAVIAEDVQNALSTHTVSFNLNYNGAHKIPSQTVVDGGYVVEPENATRTGWILKGWYDKKVGGHKFDFSTQIAEDIKLYAQWDEDISYWGPIWGNNINKAISNNKENAENKENGDTSTTYTLTFDGNGENVENLPAIQYVAKNEFAVRPTPPYRNGYLFTGWYTEKELINKFEFSSTNINQDYTLVASWLDITDMTDTDNDGIADSLETFFETNISLTDTDGDGLSDYDETTIVGSSPVEYDTNKNGINDGDDDYDSDNLSNKYEIEIGTEPAISDSDNDGLNDGDEVNIYFTDPLNYDTDGDEVSDGKEVEIGTDPLVKQNIFDLKLEFTNSNDTVIPVVEIELQGSQVESLSVEKVTNDTIFPETIPGYMGSAYDFDVSGTFDKAVISFIFDNSLESNDLDPVIYYFNEEKQEFEELPTTINNNVASTTVNHFSTYILINRKVYQETFEWTDIWDVDQNYTGVEIILVIDDSGSMTRNDSQNQRLTVAQSLVENLPENSKIGIIKFGDSTEILTKNLMEDKAKVAEYLTTNYFKSYSGYTYMYEAINKAFTLYESSDEDILKIMVVLSDGQAHDSGKHNNVITAANNNKIKIYTVGLGSSTTYFNDYLQPLANNTGGVFYLASKASELIGIYEDIGNKIDIHTDSDNDGIADYYEDNMILFNGVKILLDKNNPDTDGDGLLDGEEIKLEYYYNDDETQVIVKGKLLGSSPVSIDTDGDGLLDFYAQTNDEGKIIAPKDPNSMKYNGPLNMWKEHIYEQLNGSVPEYYCDEYYERETIVINGIETNIPIPIGLAGEIPEHIADVIVNIILYLNNPLLESEKIIRPLALLIRYFCRNEVLEKAGAFILNFIKDEYDIAYHSQPETWQRNFGYNDFYDNVFRVGSNMSYDRFEFESDSDQYAIWMWKGDYWNLENGTEIGLYIYDETKESDIGNIINDLFGSDIDNKYEGAPMEHYHVVDFEVPMTLSLYKYYSSYNITNVFNWSPVKDKQWWITGFNTDDRYGKPNPEEMVTVGSIDLSEHTDLFDNLVKTIYQKNSLNELKTIDIVLDEDNYTVWVIWWKEVRSID